MTCRQQAAWRRALLPTDLGTGEWDRQIAHIQQQYQGKMEAVAASVEEHCGRWLSFERPSGGFYLWVRLKKGLPSALVNVSSHSSLPLVAVACHYRCCNLLAASCFRFRGPAGVCWAGCVRGARAAAALRHHVLPL